MTAPDFEAKARELCSITMNGRQQERAISAALREMWNEVIEAALNECRKKTGRIVRTQTGHGLATEPRSLLEVEDGIRALKVGGKP